jgi:hypothetical protein
MKPCDTRSHVVSGYVDWRASHGDVAQAVLVPVPVPTCAAGNGGV